MTTKERDICFFTGDLKTSFVIDEVKKLSSNFHSVRVYVFSNPTEQVFADNVSVSVLNFDGYSTFGVVRKNIISFLMIAIAELFRFPSYIKHIKIYKNALSGLLRAFYLCDAIIEKEKGKRNEGTLYYSYWFNQFATALAIAKKKGTIGSFITRAHGTDLFEYRVPVTKHIPFRKFQLKYVEKVFSVSQTGADYMREKYLVYKDKVVTSYLGTEDNGLAVFNEADKFTLVSCAHVRNIKRIHLIPEILMNITFPLKWIHIGGMAKNDPTCDLLMENIQKLENSNKLVDVEMKGNLSSLEVDAFYKGTSVNLFLSVSLTEGLPVSMMEAISYGIPIMATDVGGCKEIVTPGTGVLIDKDFNVSDVAKQICEFKESEKNEKKTRSDIRGFWLEKFNSPHNFEEFKRELE